MNHDKLSAVRCISKHELTKSTLFYLLCRQSKDSKQFNHYFDRYFSHGRGDLSEDFETTKVVFETFKKINKCLITGANSLSGLQDMGVKIADTDKQAKGYLLQVGDQHQQILPSLEEISAGWMMTFRKGYADLVGLTKPTPSPKTPLVESPKRMLTTGSSHFMSRIIQSPCRNSLKPRACSLRISSTASEESQCRNLVASGSVAISFPVFWLYSLRAALKRSWNRKNDMFGLELEEDIESLD
jgi:hypothetical protein